MPAPSSALDAPWARDLLRAARLRAGQRVLDVGCEASLVARLSADRVGPGGAVVEASSHADDLPFEDRCFDVVLCRQRLQCLPDRGEALGEMRRVLVPGGRLVAAVWGPIEHNPAFAALAESLDRREGVMAAASVRWLFSLPDRADVRATLAAAGFERIRVRTTRKTIRFSSISAFLRVSVSAGPPATAVAHMSEGETHAVLRDLESALGPWVDHRGVWIATEANTAVASR